MDSSISSDPRAPDPVVKVVDVTTPDEPEPEDAQSAPEPEVVPDEPEPAPEPEEAPPEPAPDEPEP